MGWPLLDSFDRLTLITAEMPGDHLPLRRCVVNDAAMVCGVISSVQVPIMAANRFTKSFARLPHRDSQLALSRVGRTFRSSAASFASVSRRFAALTRLHGLGRFGTPFSWFELVQESAPSVDGLTNSVFKVHFPLSPVGRRPVNLEMLWFKRDGDCTPRFL